MSSPNAQTAAINIAPTTAASSSQMAHDMTMTGGGAAGADVDSPQGSSYSPPTFTLSGSFSGSPHDHQHSDEWDASKVPPSRFQKRKGSIYSTPSTRDGHVDSNYAAKFHAKYAELGYNKSK